MSPHVLDLQLQIKLRAFPGALSHIYTDKVNKVLNVTFIYKETLKYYIYVIILLLYCCELLECILPSLHRQDTFK